MPTQGSYEFKPAVKATNGFVEDAIDIKDGEWAWHRSGDFLGLFLGCPDCHGPMTLWRRYLADSKGHQVDPAGNISPSVLHRWIVNGIEQCGFHTQPTKLLNFVDVRD